MMIQLLLLLLAPQQQIEQHFQRQQGQIEQIQQQLQQQQVQLGRLLLGIGSVDGALQQLQQQQLQLGRLLQMLQSSVCSAEIRWVNGSEQKIVPSNSATVVRLNLFSTISKPTDVCLPAEIRVTASYLDASDNLVCSGAIENLAIQNTLTQSINLEIRPWDLREFSRWRNEPSQTNSGPKRLVCVNAEGLAEVTSEELARAASVRVRATVLSAGGGVSTSPSEIELRLQR
ncbi:MAG: hypothetical protein DMG12_13595 [Acidobacteria bacterium]|nr:MAG: hypothetical protein DMG12_13595 [Acidobacteriota bacterium]